MDEKNKFMNIKFSDQIKQIPEFEMVCSVFSSRRLFGELFIFFGFRSLTVKKRLWTRRKGKSSEILCFSYTLTEAYLTYEELFEADVKMLSWMNKNFIRKERIWSFESPTKISARFAPTGNIRKQFFNLSNDPQKVAKTPTESLNKNSN